LNLVPLSLPGILLFEPKVFGDSRGHFYESWQKKRYELPPFVQDNVSVSERGVLRGLHLQYPHSQGKLVAVLEGEVEDIAVDVRVGSPTFGKSISVRLSSENHRQLYLPPGFAHGFYVISERALFLYKCTDYYNKASELTIRWDDPDLNIEWPTREPLLSEKDQMGLYLKDIPEERLPRFDDFVAAPYNTEHVRHPSDLKTH
jgi:dTDP-4-dehydrorhamnose 3,5-epimerase